MTGLWVTGPWVTGLWVSGSNTGFAVGSGLAGFAVDDFGENGQWAGLAVVT